MNKRCTLETAAAVKLQFVEAEIYLKSDKTLITSVCLRLELQMDVSAFTML